jgi:hypothetical protein
VQSVAVAVAVAIRIASCLLSCLVPIHASTTKAEQNREQRTALGLGSLRDCDAVAGFRHFVKFCVIFGILVVRILRANKTSRT